MQKRIWLPAEIMQAVLKSPECRKFCIAMQASAVQQLIDLSIHKSLIMSYWMHILAMPALAVIVILSFSTDAYSANDSVKIIAKSSFVDSEGRLNVVGTLRNTGNMPVQATVGLEVQDESGKKRIDQQPTYGRIIWPLNDSPFKFVVESETTGDPFILGVKEVEAAYNDMIVLNYSSMATGEERAFVGTVKNNAPFDIYNVSIFASVRSDNATQLDTVRSNVIPVLKASEEQPFVAVPDAAVKSKVYYYSCAGLDYDKPITTIDAGDGKFIAYTLNTAAQVSAIRYENETDSLTFGIKPYSPTGGPLSFMIPQVSQNHNVTVMLDGKLHEASIRADGKTIYIDFFVPEGEHQVQIQSVSNMRDALCYSLAGSFDSCSVDRNKT